MAAEAAPPLLYPYQRRYLADASRWKAACWARQTGKTFTTTLEAVLDCLEAEAEGRAARWTILSVSRDRALDAMETGVKRHLAALGAAFEAVEQPLEADVLAHAVRLPSGGMIRAVAAKPETARGMSENLILDEFAHHRDQEAIWKALLPVVSRPGLKLRVISTPNGVGDLFHRIMTDGLGGLFSRHVVTIHDAVADGLPRDVAELRRAMADPDAWAQEFECVFLDRAAREWLAFEEILAALEAPPPPAYGGAPVFIGFDIAARGDLSVLAALEEGAGQLTLREMVVLRGRSFAEQLAELDRLFAAYRVVRACIDQTGMGEMPVEEARRRHGAYRVEGVLFTASRRLDLAIGLKDRLQRRTLRLPVPEPQRAEVIADLRSVRMIPGPSGVPRLLAEREGGAHADRFWALALACAAAGGERLAYGYAPLARRAWAPDVEPAWS